MTTGENLAKYKRMLAANETFVGRGVQEHLDKPYNETLMVGNDIKKVDWGENCRFLGDLTGVTMDYWTPKHWADAWNADDPKPGTELKTREDGSPLIPEDDPAINYTS